MKRFTSLYALLALAVLSLPSCSKYETEPKDWFTSALTFDSLDQNGIVAGYDLNNIYTYIPNGFDRIDGDFLDDGAGEAIPSRLNTAVAQYYRGSISVTNNPEPYWANSYYGIRRVTIFLKSIDRVPVVATTKRYWKAEARWLRALFYWELLKRYGGVPLLGDTLLGLTDNIRLPRATFARTVDYIVSECNAVKDSLRPETLSSSDFGRVPRGAAVALKCRVLLYAASPLFNGGGVESDPVKKELTGYPSYDAGRWQKVVDACAEFNALPYYALVTGGTSTTIASVFINKMNTDIIFSKQVPNSTSLEVNQSPVGYVISNARSFGLTSPTQNFVNAFPTIKGGSITDDVRSAANTTGYDSTNPYANRDPRLAATVFYHGLPWLNRNVQTNEGGLDKPNNPGVAPLQTRTGYYLRKFLGNFTTGTAFSSQSHNFPLFRYTEIVLNWAEALNETGQTEQAVTQINRLRARAGLTAGTNNRYGIKAAVSQAEMRALIQNERRIELAFEEHRFWDIRRWKTAPQVLDNATLNGVRITVSGTATTYQTVPLVTTAWANRLYHMPLPFTEITANPTLIQNEGW